MGDEILLRLVENRSTGYTWQIEEPAGTSSVAVPEVLAWDGGQNLAAYPMRTGQLALPSTDDVLRVAADRHLEIETSPRPPELASGPSQSTATSSEPNQAWLREVLGTGGVREIAVIAENRGDGLLRVELRPPWDAEAPAVATVSLVIRVVAPHELDGFAARQPLAHVARLAA